MRCMQRHVLNVARLFEGGAPLLVACLAGGSSQALPSPVLCTPAFKPIFHGYVLRATLFR